MKGLTRDLIQPNPWINPTCVSSVQLFTSIPGIYVYSLCDH